MAIRDFWKAEEIAQATFGARSVDEQVRYCFDEAASAVGDFVGDIGDAIDSGLDSFMDFAQPVLNIFAPEIGIPLSIATNLAEDDWMGAGLSALGGFDIIPSDVLGSLGDVASSAGDMAGSIGSNVADDWMLSGLGDAANTVSEAPISVLESISPEQIDQGFGQDFSKAFNPDERISRLSEWNKASTASLGPVGQETVQGVNVPDSGFRLSDYYRQQAGMFPPESAGLPETDPYTYGASDWAGPEYGMQEVSVGYGSGAAPDSPDMNGSWGNQDNSADAVGRIQDKMATQSGKLAADNTSILDKLKAKWDKMDTMTKVGLGLGALGALGGLAGNKKGASPLTRAQIESMRGKYDTQPLPPYAYNLQNASGQGFNPKTYGRVPGNAGRRFFTGSLVPVAAAHGGEIGHYAKGGVLNAMRRNTPVRGPGGGQDDVIPAMLSDGEHVLDADTVSALGDGSNEAGHKKIEQMKHNLRKHKRSAPANKIPPKAKSVLAYMGGKI